MTMLQYLFLEDKTDTDLLPVPGHDEYVVMDWHCANPDCDCTDFVFSFCQHIEGQKFPEPVADLRYDLASDTLTATGRAADGPATLSADSAIVTAFLDWIRSDGKDRLLSRMREIKRGAKDDPSLYIDLTGIELNTKVVYPVLFGWQDQEAFVFRDGATPNPIVVVDHYCLHPECNCNNAVLEFFEVEGDYDPRTDCDPGTEGTGTVIFTVQFEFDGEYSFIDCEWPKAQARALIESKIKADTELRALLEARYKRVKKLGVKVVFQRMRKEIKGRTRSKVGRNDPCPCGSGKKFKKCCGRR